MDIRLHHLKPFPLSLRADFELPAWPYTKNMEHLALFEKYLRDLSVIRYEDSEIDDGSFDYDFAFTIEDYTSGGKKIVLPVDAYFSRVAVDPDTFKVLSWPRNRDHEADPQWLENVENNPISGDMLAWSHYNTKIILHQNMPHSLKWEPRNDGKKYDGKMEKQGSSVSSDFLGPNAPRIRGGNN